MNEAELVHRLSRYGFHCIAHTLDHDFADAVQEAIRYISMSQIEFNQKEMSYIARLAEMEDCRNELCLKCGEYKLDNCGECRWRR
jgi:hypothetical protein